MGNESRWSRLWPKSPERRRAAVRLVPATQVSFTELVGLRSVRLDVREHTQAYVELLKTPLAGFRVERPGRKKGELEFVIVGPQLDPVGVNQVLYYAARHKGFKLDTYDLIKDWRGLYSNDPENIARLKRHAKMPGWDSFEAARHAIYGILNRNYKLQAERFHLTFEPEDVLSPVIHGKRDRSGNIQLSLEPMDRGLQVAIAEQTGRRSDQLSDGLGHVLVAGASPDNAQWPLTVGYGNAVIEKFKDDYIHREDVRKDNVIGPTQVLAFIYRRLAEKQSGSVDVPDNQDIQQSPALREFVRHIEATVAPTPRRRLWSGRFRRH